MVMTDIEKGYFLSLFNRNGNIPGFNVDEFNAFTMRSIGTPLCQHYGLSKGKSLIKYVYEASDEDSTKLLLDLLIRYEKNYSDFHHETGYGDEDEVAPLWAEVSNGKEPQYKKIYEKCKAVAERLTGGNQYTNTAAKNLKEVFSSDYINKQIDIMMRMVKEHPTDAIGKAKELIESCCKTILDYHNESYDPKWDVLDLTKRTREILKITPEDIDVTVKGANAIKAILGSLGKIVQSIAELRNDYGSGHGKEAEYKGLEERHANLVVGATSVLVEFLWASHLRIQSKKQSL